MSHCLASSRALSRSPWTRSSSRFIALSCSTARPAQPHTYLTITHSALLRRDSMPCCSCAALAQQQASQTSALSAQEISTQAPALQRRWRRHTSDLCQSSSVCQDAAAPLCWASTCAASLCAAASSRL